MEDGLWQEYKDDGVLVYGVNDESLPVLLNFLEQVGITFPVILGEPEGYTLFGGQSPFPRDYIIDPNGIVQYVNTEYRPTEMSVIIERLLPTATPGEEEDVTDSPLPRGVLLGQNFPNPFNPSTTISFEIGSEKGPSEVDLSIYNLRGKRVRTLISGKLEPGQHSLVWDGTDDSQNPLPSGAYIYRLKVGKENRARKMILAR